MKAKNVGYRRVCVNLTWIVCSLLFLLLVVLWQEANFELSSLRKVVLGETDTTYGENRRSANKDTGATQKENHLLSRQSLNGRRHQEKKRMKRLPQGIIIGQQKAGTKALLVFLMIHPDIVTPSSEVHFFDNKRSYARGLEYYRQQMPMSEPHQITIEKTPRYFRAPYVPERIRQMNESIKLLLIVREPVSRMISEYWFNKRHAKIKKEDTFEVSGRFSALENYNICLFCGCMF